MSMQAASLEVLERANVPAPQARAIVQAIEIEIGSAQNVLATKLDLAEHRAATQQEITDFRVETKVALAGLETKIEASAKEVLTRMYFAVLAQLSVLLGAAYFFVTHLKP